MGGKIMSKHTFRRALVALSCVALVAGSTPALAENIATSDDGAAMLGDLFIVRPISLVGSILGAAVWIVTLPFTLTTQSTDEAARELLGKPLEYTFNRPLGDFDHCGHERRACGDF
jgi:hypothetical protein